MFLSVDNYRADCGELLPSAVSLMSKIVYSSLFFSLSLHVCACVFVYLISYLTLFLLGIYTGTNISPAGNLKIHIRCTSHVLYNETTFIFIIFKEWSGEI